MATTDILETTVEEMVATTETQETMHRQEDRLDLRATTAGIHVAQICAIHVIPETYGTAQLDSRAEMVEMVEIREIREILEIPYAAVMTSLLRVIFPHSEMHPCAI